MQLNEVTFDRNKCHSDIANLNSLSWYEVNLVKLHKKLTA